MFIPSKYNFFVNNDNHHLIFNALTKSLASLNDAYYACIESYPRAGKSTLSETKEELLRCGFLVADDVDEYQLALLKYQAARFSTGETRLIIAPTTSCNFNCSYCFEQRVKRYSPSPDLIDAIYRFIRNVHDESKRLHISWYGGEPLLEGELIRNFVEGLARITSSPIRQDIITNGYLLTESTAATLSSLGISEAQITLDGLSSTHDSRRSLYNGSPTFNRVYDNVLTATKYMDIAIRMNVDRTNLSSCIHLLESFARLGLQNKIFPYIAPIDDVGKNCAISNDELCTVEEFTKFERTFYKRAIDLKFRVFPLTARFNGICDAVTADTYVINPDATFGKCWDTVGDKTQVCGRLSKFQLASRPLLNWLSFLPLREECANCPIFPICYGGCPRQSMNEGHPSCLAAKYNIHDLMWLEYCSRKQVPTSDFVGKGSCYA